MSTDPASARGFSLIELLMVIAIIAILLALLIPSMQGGREKALNIVCLANLRALAGATIHYTSDHEGQIPSSFPGPGALNWVGHGNLPEHIRSGALWPYLGKVDLYACPSVPKELPRIRRQIRHYSMNNYLNGRDWYPAIARRYGAIPRPNRTIMFLEEPDPRGYNIGSWVMRLFADQWVDPIGFWHDYGSNFSFADGHTEHWTWKDPRTEIPGLDGRFFVNQPGNPDLRKMQQHQMPGDPAGPNP